MEFIQNNRQNITQLKFSQIYLQIWRFRCFLGVNFTLKILAFYSQHPANYIDQFYPPIRIMLTNRGSFFPQLKFTG